MFSKKFLGLFPEAFKGGGGGGVICMQVFYSPFLRKGSSKLSIYKWNLQYKQTSYHNMKYAWNKQGFYIIFGIAYPVFFTFKC